MKSSIKMTLFVIPFFIVCSCASKHSIVEYDNNVFEIVYSSEGESWQTIAGKMELMAAYVAERKGCEWFGKYTGISNAQRSEFSMGILSPRQTNAIMYKCASNVDDIYLTETNMNTKQVIQIQESRYGSLRNIVNK